MKKLLIIISLLITAGVRSQTVLGVPTVIQQQNQWCWSASTNCILSYYGVTTSQCQIAEYTRNVATWHNFGSVNCCSSATAGCNYWNYNWGCAGSMEDILMNFGSISITNLSYAIPSSVINTEINGNRPFLIRWGWFSGGGHFIVGRGYDASNQNVYYMNPWPGEGAKVASYNWMVNDSVHSWTHTQLLLTNPPTSTSISETESVADGINIYPNPSTDKININSKHTITFLQLFDVAGKEVYSSNDNNGIDVKANHLSKGLYLLKLSGENFSVHKKVILE
jgi:hypothetical protein